MERLNNINGHLVSNVPDSNSNINKKNSKNRAIIDDPTKVKRNPMLNQIDEDLIRLLNSRRKESTIDPKNIKETLLGPDIHLTEKIWAIVENDPELNDIYYYDTDRDEYRRKGI